MAHHNPVSVEIINRDRRGEATVIHVVEYDHEWRPVEGGLNVRLTGGESIPGELGGGNKFVIEAE